MKLKYLFRKPKYPVICDFDGYLIGAYTSSSFIKDLVKYDLENLVNNKFYHVIDSTGEGWSFSANHMAISPLSFKKRWTKKEVIRMYNNRKNKSYPNKDYSEQSIPVKRFDKIVQEIVDLLNRFEMNDISL